MIEHTQPESLQDFEDRRKVASLCSRCEQRLLFIMTKLDEIRDVLEAIDVPSLSTYKRVSELGTAALAAAPIANSADVVSGSESVSSFKPPQKKDLASLTLTLAKNLEMQLGQRKG